MLEVLSNAKNAEKCFKYRAMLRMLTNAGSAENSGSTAEYLVILSMAEQC